MKFPVNSLLAGNLAFSETSSQLTPPSSGESSANLTWGQIQPPCIWGARDAIPHSLHAEGQTRRRSVQSTTTTGYARSRPISKLHG